MQVTSLARILPGVLVLWLAMSAGTTQAAFFSINSNGDGADQTPGDGACATGAVVSGGQPECTLRAAIEEANALAGIDFVRVAAGIATDVNGFVQIIPLSALPPITDLLLMDLDNAPGYDAGDPFATPIVQLSGALAGGLVAHGIQIQGGSAAGTRIRALAVHGFSGIGIDVDAAFVNVHGCQVGIADGNSTAGNGSHGIRITGDQVVIGQEFNEGAGWQEKGNVVSGNQGRGIEVSGDDAVVAGNRIGTDPSGLVAMRNRGDGILVDGARAAIGAVRTRTNGQEVASGNLISGNDDFVIAQGILVASTATDTTIEANQIGTDATGNVALPNVGGGIRVIGWPTTIGSPMSPMLGANLVSGNGGSGIEVRGGTAVRDVTIKGNLIGVRADGSGPLGNAEDGVQADLVGNLRILDNVVGGNGNHGIDVSAGSVVLVLDNLIGTDASSADRGNTSDGIRLVDVVGGFVNSGSAPHVVAFNGGTGIRLERCSACEVVGGHIGNAFGEFGAGNGLHGIHIIDSDSLHVEHNQIGANGGDGIRIDGGPHSTGNSIRDNAIFDNVGIGIDLGGDGPTPNDPDDADLGENELMNHPELDSAATFYDTATGLIDVSYRLDASPSFVDYPVQIDFYEADADGEEGWRLLGSLSLASPTGPGFVSDSFAPPPNGSYDDAMMLATAMDANFNTSEFGAPVPLPEPGLLQTLVVGATAIPLLVRRRAGRRLPRRSSRDDPAHASRRHRQTRWASSRRSRTRGPSPGGVLPEDKEVASSLFRVE